MRYGDDRRGITVGGSAARQRAHIHDLQIVEIVFDDGVAVRLLECWCGATDADAAA
jgi:hypothetical protein